MISKSCLWTRHFFQKDDVRWTSKLCGGEIVWSDALWDIETCPWAIYLSASTVHVVAPGHPIHRPQICMHTMSTEGDSWKYKQFGKQIRNRQKYLEGPNWDLTVSFSKTLVCNGRIKISNLSICLYMYIISNLCQAHWLCLFLTRPVVNKGVNKIDIKRVRYRFSRDRVTIVCSLWRHQQSIVTSSA